MRQQLPILLSALLAASSFACQKEKKDQEIPESVGKPVKPLAKMARASIASVQMLKDCPDPVPASPAVRQAPSKAARVAPSEMAANSDAPADRGYPEPCQQSTMQIDFAGQGEESAKVHIKGVRLLSREGKELAPIATRSPSMWKESVYSAWDGVLPSSSDLKASYKLTPPNWSDVESKIGGRSHGQIFMLEATIEIGGQVQVIRSIEFARIQPEMVPT